MSNIVEAKFIELTDITANTTIQTNVEAGLIYPFVDLAQRIWILPVLSTPLYAALSDDIVANGLTGVTASHALLLNALRPALIWATASEAIPFLRTKITNKGIVFKSSTDQSEAATSEAIANLKSSMAAAAQTYVQDLKRFLRANKDLYPLWQEEYFAMHEVDSGATYSNGTSEYFSGIVFDNDLTYTNKYRKFL